MGAPKIARHKGGLFSFLGRFRPPSVNSLEAKLSEILSFSLTNLKILLYYCGLDDSLQEVSKLIAIITFNM